MPVTLQSDLVVTAPATTISVALEPAQNMVHSLTLLNYVDQLSGLDEWVTRTAAAMSPERRHNNQLVFEGLHFSVAPIQSWASFEDYMNNLAQTSPLVLRDRLLEHICCFQLADIPRGVKPKPQIEPRRILESVDVYINYLIEQIGEEHVKVEIERETHSLLNDPTRMHALILYHIQTMWRDYASAEWARVAPILQEVVEAFRSFDFERSAPVDAVRQVTRQELRDKWEALINRSQTITLVPSAHVGPYSGKFTADDALWLIFGAYLPDGLQASKTFATLSRSQLLVRLSALNDDTRLRILELLAQQPELCAQDIITLLDLSQPAASRHLKQLSATGYINERRRDGAKCYTLNPERIEETFQMLERFLGKSSLPWQKPRRGFPIAPLRRPAN